MAQHHLINGKRPVTTFCTDRSKYFDLGTKRVFDTSLLLSEPAWQLFAYDFENRNALFVKTTAGPDLFKAPFLHQELYNRAVELVTVPFADFIKLSMAAAEPNTIVHLLSIGRCGSTLAHHLFNNADGVLSVSEPDTYIGLTMARSTLDDSLSLDLLRAANRFHFKSGANRYFQTLIVKHHSQTMFMAERLRSANPRAKFIFMYREGESWANSVCQMAQSYEFPILQDRKAREMFWHIVSGGQDEQTMSSFIDPENEKPEGDRWIAVLWAVYMREYLRLWAHQFKMLAINYAELNAERLISVHKMFTYSGLSVDQLEQVMVAFDTDSQAGTSLAKEHKTEGFSKENYSNFRETLLKFKEIESPRMILPSL